MESLSELEALADSLSEQLAELRVENDFLQEKLDRANDLIVEISDELTLMKRIACVRDVEYGG